MASNVKECKSWGIIGCGWLGQAAARSILAAGGNVWGTGRTPRRLKEIEAAGAVPIALDLAASAQGEDAVPSCDALLIALPPSACVHPMAVQRLRATMEKANWSVVISSTSVYSTDPGTYTEADAVRRISPHSGICVLDVERALDMPHTSFLRAGGLIGPKRPLFRPSASTLNDHKVLNVVHQEDVVRAVIHLAKIRCEGATNILCPVPRTRGECRSGKPAKAAHQTDARSISVDRLLQSGFSFGHPDPLSMANLHA